MTVRGIVSRLAGSRSCGRVGRVGRSGRRWYRIAAAVAAIAGLAALLLGAAGQLFPGGAGLVHP